MGRGERGTARLTTQLVEVLKVALGHRGDVLAAEHADFEVLVRTGRKFCAAGLEVAQILVDDLISAYMPGDVEAVALVGNQLARGGEVDAAVGKEKTMVSRRADMQARSRLKERNGLTRYEGG